MKLIAGLGNPGEQYQSSRHNLGFLTLDYLAGRHDIPLKKQGFEALFGKGKIGNETVLLAKPQTYMNLSGIALERLVSYFKVDIKDLIVVHDDLDLPFETIRLKKGGGEGGHKGLMSIVQHVGSADFIRVRIGIGKPMRKAMVEKYVLSPFAEEEQNAVPSILAVACDVVGEVILSGVETAMQRYHGKTINEIVI
ncbi:MAG TPA: aminoacyl-tRNA hydrolase [Syntrophales bacterium]|nr:aminoacyl-tRNA hydrolase [Syntrophales bacterium]